MSLKNHPSRPGPDPHGPGLKSPPSGPEHIAIVMDGNGRWATGKNRPRSMGHQAGLKALRAVARHCGKIGTKTLTVFAFSSENWNRPKKEVNRLMDLFMRALDKETKELHENGVRLCFIGDIQAFETNLRDSIQRATRQTAYNTQMTLNVAVNYGGRWDIAEAARKLARAAHQGLIDPDDIDEAMMSRQICLEGNDPDLFIRTGGEMRISNFLLWQSAYTEFYFTPLLWPDFSPEELDKAVAVYHSRERRFGLTSEQIREKSA